VIDEKIFRLMDKEREHQNKTLSLIASENYASEDVICALGSVLTNKYAEGVPELRYYKGCKVIDKIENLAIERLISLFHAEAGNVQPHSGTQANMAIYFAVLNPKDYVLSLSTVNGGHLSHGSLVNFSGELYNFVHYGVDENGFIDYENVEYLAKKYRPKLIVCGASSYSRIIDFERFKKIAESVDALLMVDMAHIAGLVAAELHPSPVPFADFVTSTTQKTLRGPRGGFILCQKKYERIINKAVFPGIQGGPLMNVIAAKAVCFAEAMTSEFKSYISQVLKNAKEMAEKFSELKFDVVTGGTENHSFVLDLTKFELDGEQFSRMLEEVGINVSKQTVPNDKLGWKQASGVRIGTPAITTRGFDTDACDKLVDLINLVVRDFDGSKEYVKSEVAKLASQFPIYNYNNKHVDD
jgi:glycine hydroxymethyltransferase